MTDTVLNPEVAIVWFPPGRRIHRIGPMTIKGNAVVFHTSCGLPISEADTTPVNGWGAVTCPKCRKTPSPSRTTKET